jgi:arylsulfatase A-like enzyme
VSQPNILFVLADQMRPDAWAHAKTPHLDALAARGVRFANATCASPLCQPSRACIVTGQFPTQHGICGNMNEPISPQQRQDTYPAHLQRAGYHTALIGKHHYLDRWATGIDVLQDDETLEGYGYHHVWQVVDDHLHNEDRYTRFLRRIDKLDRFQEMTRTRAYDPDVLTPSEFDDGYIGEMAVQYVQDYPGDAPLYLQVGFLGPHPPYWAPGEYATMYDPQAMVPPRAVSDPRMIQRAQRARAAYLGRVSLIDTYLGRLVDALDAKGMLEDTLVVFTADHGDLIGDYGIFDKRHFYEHSLGVPLVMAGPGIELESRLGGRTCRELVSGVDLYPTFTHAAGCEERLGNAPREGLSLLDVANYTGPLRDAVFSELGTAMMVRDANWKLVYDAEQGGVQQLYNMRRNPRRGAAGTALELDNLAGVTGYERVEKELVERLLSRLIRLTHHTQQKERERLQRVRV